MHLALANACARCSPVNSELFVVYQHSARSRHVGCENCWTRKKQGLTKHQKQYYTYLYFDMAWHGMADGMAFVLGDRYDQSLTEDGPPASMAVLIHLRPSQFLHKPGLELGQYEASGHMSTRPPDLIDARASLAVGCATHSSSACRSFQGILHTSISWL